MLAQDINAIALKHLSFQEWDDAQKLFLKNAKENPMHQTYNNLGYFLVSEGFFKNGKVKNGLRLGIKYLFKAARLGNSITNMCAVVHAIDYKLRGATKIEAKYLHRYACYCLKKALDMDYSNELMYNFLSFSYLLNPQNQEILPEVRVLVKELVTRESISLYFELLRMNSLTDEGLVCIDKYREFLDEVDLLMFYSKAGLYEKGYSLCEKVYSKFGMDKYIASAIVECCINTNHLEAAQRFANLILDDEIPKAVLKWRDWRKDVFKEAKKSTVYRKKLIVNYRYFPSIIKSCCYFGCPLHNTPW